jgi:signal transduction histidine kinase
MTPWITNRSVNAYVLAVGSPIILLLLRVSLHPLLNDSGPFVFFTPAVMISAWYGGLGPGLVATVLGAALGDYFFLGELGFDFDSASIARVLLFLFVGGQISWLSGALLNAKTRLEARVRDRTAELEFRKSLLESQSNASLDGILFASDDGKVIFNNRRLLDLWNLPAGAFSSMDSAMTAMRARIMGDQNLLDRPLVDDAELSSELPPSLMLRDGRTLESYSADVRSAEGKSYGRVWYFRDVTERRRLAKQILEAGERERQRIGLDLHDDLCPHLTGVACLGRVLQQHLEQQCPGEADSAARLVELVEQAVRRARDLARGLQPLQMKPDGLAAGLAQLAANVESLFKVRCECRPGDEPVVLEDTATGIHLYHIAQEAVNNAVRHGKAGEIVLELGRVGNSFLLSIKDNGVGIGPNPGAGMGLQTMRHRARLVGGSMTVEPGESGKGTVVRCRLPARRTAGADVNGTAERPND